MEKQTDINTASFRVLRETPGHITFGIWINGGKAGELTVRVEEQFGLTRMLTAAGFINRTLVD